MAKNKDDKGFNRSGTLNVEDMTVTYEDKNGIYVFDLKSKIQEFDGEEVSITVATVMNPSHIQDEGQ